MMSEVVQLGILCFNCNMIPQAWRLGMITELRRSRVSIFAVGECRMNCRLPPVCRFCQLGEGSNIYIAYLM